MLERHRDGERRRPQQERHVRKPDPVLGLSGRDAPVRLFRHHRPHQVLLPAGRGPRRSRLAVPRRASSSRGRCSSTSINHESWCVYVIGGSNNTFEMLDAHHNMGPGFFIQAGGNNTFLNCDSHENEDTLTSNGDGQSADGFGCHPNQAGDTGNVFRGCRAWWNSDDGWDFINSAGGVHRRVLVVLVQRLQARRDQRRPAGLAGGRKRQRLQGGRLRRPSDRRAGGAAAAHDPVRLRLLQQGEWPLRQSRDRLAVLLRQHVVQQRDRRGHARA